MENIHKAAFSNILDFYVHPVILTNDMLKDIKELEGGKDYGKICDSTV